MDGAEFDRLVSRARDPRLISGVYNYCDGRCRRCPFTQRCLAYLDSLETKTARGDEGPVAHQFLNLAQAMLGALDVFERLGENSLFYRREVAFDVWIDVMVQQGQGALYALVVHRNLGPFPVRSAAFQRDRRGVIRP